MSDIFLLYLPHSTAAVERRFGVVADKKPKIKKQNERGDSEYNNAELRIPKEEKKLFQCWSKMKVY